MGNRYKGCTFVAIALTVSVLGVLQLNAQANRLARSVIGSGGVIAASSGDRLLSSTVGQVAIGTVAAADRSLYQGFWLPLFPTTSVNDASTVIAGDVINYPNPFAASTTISFRSALIGQITVNIYDIIGNLVKTLTVDTDGSTDPVVVWDGRDTAGGPVASGAYVYEVRATKAQGGVYHRVQRMNVVR